MKETFADRLQLHVHSCPETDFNLSAQRQGDVEQKQSVRHLFTLMEYKTIPTRSMPSIPLWGVCRKTKATDIDKMSHQYTSASRATVSSFRAKTSSLGEIKQSMSDKAIWHDKT